MPNYPPGVFRFSVEIDGLTVGGFSEVSGLNIEIETEQIREGGLNNFVHNLPKKVKYNNLVLKRGMTVGDDLLKWFTQCKDGNITRKNGAVTLMDREGKVAKIWVFVSAYPVKLLAPNLNSKSDSDVAIETIELVHSGISKTF
jgi:phage tail-like protein